MARLRLPLLTEFGNAKPFAVAEVASARRSAAAPSWRPRRKWCRTRPPGESCPRPSFCLARTTRRMARHRKASPSLPSRHKSYTRINGVDRRNCIYRNVLVDNDPVSLPAAVNRTRFPCPLLRQQFAGRRANDVTRVIGALLATQ